MALRSRAATRTAMAAAIALALTGHVSPPGSTVVQLSALRARNIASDLDAKHTAQKSLAKLRSVYCISSSNRSMSTISKRFEADHVPLKHWPAVDAGIAALRSNVQQWVDGWFVEPSALPRKLITDEWREAWKQGRRWRPIRRGPWRQGIDLSSESLGSALSHLLLWHEICELTSVDPGAADDIFFVVDDACRLLPEFSLDALEERLAGVPDGWQIVFLGGSDMLGAHSQHEVADGVRQLYPWLRPASAYLVTGSGARAVLRTCAPLRWQLDLQLAGYFSSTLENEAASQTLLLPTPFPASYSLWPPLAEQRRSRSWQRRPLSTQRASGALGREAGPHEESNETSQLEKDFYEHLDFVIFWAMRLTERPVRRGSREREIEGHSNLVPELRAAMNDLVAGPDVETICEIGFNGGHGTLRWLLNSKARVFSFDLCEHDYCKPAAAWLSAQFPGRFHVEWGDSTTTVPEFLSKHPEVECDLLFIDGGHSYDVAMADITNFRKMANPRRHRVLLDDTHLSGPNDAWTYLVTRGFATEMHRAKGFQEGVGSYGFVIGNYTDAAMSE